MIREQVLPASGMFVDDTPDQEQKTRWTDPSFRLSLEIRVFHQRAAVQTILNVIPVVLCLTPMLSTTKSRSLSLVHGMF